MAHVTLPDGYAELTPEEQAATGTHPNLVRLSVGIESIDDIIADIDIGFAAAAQV